MRRRDKISTIHWNCKIRSSSSYMLFGMSSHYCCWRVWVSSRTPKAAKNLRYFNFNYFITHLKYFKFMFILRHESVYVDQSRNMISKWLVSIKSLYSHYFSSRKTSSFILISFIFLARIRLHAHHQSHVYINTMNNIY